MTKPTNAHPALPRYTAATYWFGDIVYLRIRAERKRGMVLGMTIRPTGIVYYVQWDSGDETCHYEMELTNEFVPNFESD